MFRNGVYMYGGLKREGKYKHIILSEEMARRTQIFRGLTIVDGFEITTSESFRRLLELGLAKKGLIEAQTRDEWLKGCTPRSV